MTFKSLKKRVRQAPRTLGEHLVARRHGLGLYQRDVAKQLGVSVETVLHWEKDQTSMPDKMWPAVIAYLGYDPFACPADAPLGERLRQWRRVRGLSIKRAAKHVGVNEGTWAKWEAGSEPANNSHRDIVNHLLS
ncbi:MAG: helix-turn-helix domain-containing protein [Phycisphaeraceae bacterium]|nr:helix-turn-helix domain-containing protein [Phycisphaeraceae bacterium]